MTYLPPDEAKNLLAGILMDFVEGDNLGDYLKHCGFDVGAIGTPANLLPAWVGHYRIGQGTYDTDRALLDFTTWPPIARAILSGMAKKQSLAN